MVPIVIAAAGVAFGGGLADAGIFLLVVGHAAGLLLGFEPRFDSPVSELGVLLGAFIVSQTVYRTEDRDYYRAANLA